MCSLYSINNNSKFAGQSSFQVVLCAKGSDSNSNSNSNSNSGYHRHSSPSSAPSSPSAGSSWSAPCSHSKRKKMKGGTSAAPSGKGPVLILSSSHQGTSQSNSSMLSNSPAFQSQCDRISNSLHYPPLSRTTLAQSYSSSRRRHSSHGATHWQQFHQHHQHHHSYEASFEHDTIGLEHGHALSLVQSQSQTQTQAQDQTVSPQKRTSPSSNDRQTSASYKDAGNRRSSPILDPADTIQVLSKRFCPPSPSQAQLTPCNPSVLSSHSAHLSRTADTALVSFAAAVASAANSTSPAMSSPRSVLSSFFRSKDASVPLDVSSSTVANPGPKTGECAGATLLDVSVHPTHPVYPVDKPIHYRSSIVPHGSSDEDRVDDLSSPMGTSVDSTNNETFDGDEMDLQRSLNDASDSDSPMTAAGTAKYPLSAQAALRPENGSLFKLERKSRLRRQVNRLRTKNAALKSTVAQVKSDLALERQRRSTMDQIYLNIKKELNQKLETEEIKVLNLKGELEQMTAEMQELKDQLASARASSSKNSNGSSAGYKIGYDSSAFSLSGGFSELGGLILHHHANVNLVDSQDDSEEFLASHSYAASTRQTDSTLLATSGSGAMALNENEEDENDEDDDLSGDDDDDDEIDSGVSFSLIRTPKTLTPTASCRSSVSSDNLHPALAEEESEQMEDYTEQSDDDDSDKEYEDAPCTMMEIILQRQQSRSSEDEMNDPPADATETFESMAQKAMLQATQSKFTVAQTQLQLEELVLKFDARPEQTADVIAKEVSRWWEAERVATGGPFAGGWGHETVIISKETGERVSPKVAVERQVESFFGPLLLQFVTTLSEQRVLLDKLGECARADPQSLKNHNAVLVALYKYDVVEAEAVLEWWHSLEEPQGVFGHGGNNLRSLNSKFVAWLEDEEDDSESADDEDDDENDDDSGSDSDSCCSDMEEDEDEVEEDDDDGVVDSILDLAFPEIKPSSTPPPSTLQTAVSESTQDRSSAEPKRRISFCNNNMYYNQDGYAGVEDVDPMEETKTEKKKYTQCPRMRESRDEEEEE